MRLTRETLIKIARDTASQRARVSRRIICIYLTGSVLSESPLLGGTTDIDLVIIHDSEPVQAREVARLSDEVSLDIAHYDQEVFRQPRHLRTDPWLGPFIYKKPMVLYDTQHWFDFAQAATGAQFFQPDNVLQRARTLSQAARQTWIELELNTSPALPGNVYKYLDILENAGNALVCLTGESDPLTERRFLLQLPQRLQALHQPDLVSGLTSLLVSDPSKLEGVWNDWERGWKDAYTAASSLASAPPRLQPFRQLYYERAAAALWNENLDAALWLLFRTWTLAVSTLEDNAPQVNTWQLACQTLGLDGEHFQEKVQAVDHYLDQVEETLDSWGQANGVSDTPNQ